MAAENAARKAQEHGVKKVDVFVKGPWLGPRDRDPRSLQAAGQARSVRSPMSSAAAQRLPSAQAAPGLGKGTTRQWLVTPDLPPASHAAWASTSSVVTNRSKRPYPPGQHGRARIKESEYRQQLQEKQKARFTYGVMSKAVPSLLRGRPRGSLVRPVRTCLRILEAGWTTSSTGPVWPDPRMARQLVSHGHFTVNGVKVNVPSYRVSQYDIIDVRDNSLNTVPFQIARRRRRAPDPGLAVGRRRTSAGTGSPVAEREQISVPLAEQLIVEFYSGVHFEPPPDGGGPGDPPPNDGQIAVGSEKRMKEQC